MKDSISKLRKILSDNYIDSETSEKIIEEWINFTRDELKVISMNPYFIFLKQQGKKLPYVNQKQYLLYYLTELGYTQTELSKAFGRGFSRANIMHAHQVVKDWLRIGDEMTLESKKIVENKIPELLNIKIQEDV